MIDPSKPPVGSNLELPTLRALVEPYPQLVAGTPTGWSFTRASRTFQAQLLDDARRAALALPRGRRSARSRRRRSCTAAATASPSVAASRCQSAAPRRCGSRPAAERPGSPSPCRPASARPRLVPSAEAPLSAQRAPATDSSAASSPSSSGRTEADPHERAAVRRVARLDEPAVRLGGLAHDREAESRAGLRARVPGAVEAVEHEREILLVEARAVVADRQRAVRERRPRSAPSGGLHLHRVVEQVGDGARDPVGLATHERRLDRRAGSAGWGARRRARSSACETIWSRRTSPSSPLGFEPRASSTTSPTSAVSSSSSSIMSARSAARSSGESSDSSRISCRFARIEAIGVRSSCEASATRLRCDADRLLERVERRVERPAEAGELVVPADVEAARARSARGWRRSPRSGA